MTVHFPVALLVVSFIFSLLAILRKHESFHTTSFYLLIAACIGLLLAYKTGDDAGAWLEESPLRNLIHEHENASYYSIAVTLVATLLLSLDQMKSNKILRNAGTAVLLLAVGLLLRTAHLGGNLVYEHGAGVKAATVLTPQAGE